MERLWKKQVYIYGRFPKVAGIYLELPRMKKKSNFPLRMDGKTLEKNSHIFTGASESENISALSS
jgi:hypothetical protein